MSRRFRTRCMPAFALAALVACESPTEPTPLIVPNTTLEAVGDAAQLVANNAGDRLPHWVSLDPSIATVTPAGMVVAVSAGTATVRATLGSRTAQGTVTVLPPIDVTVSDLAVVTSADGASGVSMRLRNEGGRGYYRLEHWKERSEGETEHRRILYNANDHEAQVGMDVGHQSFLTAETADWVVVYSREPLSVEYRLTGCIRLDGAAPCPMP